MSKRGGAGGGVNAGTLELGPCHDRAGTLAVFGIDGYPFDA